MKTRIAIRMLIISLIVGVCFYYALVFVTKIREYEAYHSDYTRNTTPLPVNTIQDICQQFIIPTDDPRCLSGAIVYAVEFFPDIKAYFEKIPDEEANLQEVTHKLGRYFNKCEDPVKPRNQSLYYRCWYDLRGDGIYSIVFYFNEDDIIETIIASSSGS